jgi:hypothetical protein
MQLTLSAEDRKLLERLLEHALMDKRVEVRRTSTPRYHDDMAIEESRLQDLLGRVRALAGEP